MNCFQIKLPNFEQLARPDQNRAVASLIPLFAHFGHFRLLTYVTPWQLDEVTAARREVAMAAAEAWQQQGLREEVQLIRRLARHRRWLRVSHYLLVEDEDLTAADLRAWGLLAEPAVPPAPAPGHYQEQIDHLAPVQPGRNRGGWTADYSRPCVTILASYQLERIWSVEQPLADLVTQAEGPLLLAVDIRPVRPEAVEMAANSWLAVLNEGRRSADQEAQKALAAAEHALNASGEAVHDARLAVLLLEQDLATLRRRARSLRRRLSRHAGVDRLLGYQQAAAGLFRPELRPAGLPTGHFNILSSGAAVMAGVWGFGSTQAHEGIYVGEKLSLHGGTRGLYYLQGWRGQRPHHLNAFGKTGAGKSTNVRALLAREAEQGTQIVVLDPQPHVRLFAQLFDADTLDYHAVGSGRLTFNPLDVVWDRLEQQSDHVRAILKLLLNPDGDTPRRFDARDVAALDAALKLTYEGYEWEELLTNPAVTPTLEIFCKRLEQCGRGGQTLAQELGGLYVAGERAETFNQPSSLDTRLRKPVVIYDFSPVFAGHETGLEALYYFITFSGIYREVRAHPERRQIIFVDEFGAMMRQPGLARSLALMYKTFRTFRAGMWLADQNPFTLAGLGDGAWQRADAKEVELKLSILRNTTRTLAFNLDYDDALQLQTLYPRQILDTHVAFLTQAEPGQAVIRSDDEGTDLVYFALKPNEARCLMGS